MESVLACKSSLDKLLDVTTYDNSEVASSCKPNDDEDTVEDGEDLKNLPLLIALTLLSAPEVVEDANSGLLLHSLELL